MRSELFVEGAVRSHVVVMDEGDSVVECLNHFFERSSVRSARVIALGALECCSTCASPWNWSSRLIGARWKRRRADGASLAVTVSATETLLSRFESVLSDPTNHAAVV
jgi:hypothetical protein